MIEDPIHLTEYSHGAGCGCKISPEVLATILASQQPSFVDPNLLVGNQSCDDAAVYKLNEEVGIISTTDFFMPIVDDPFTFGRIAATNAISDIYAMGGKPIMAIAILGWPINKLSADVAQQVVDGGRQACADAGICLAGGHSIDSPEPIFGLAVTGQVALDRIKRNDTAREGDLIYLTKPLGIGILTTAQKQKKIAEGDTDIAVNAMCQLNKIGEQISRLDGVHAMTDVTGFGLAGHLLEMCWGANLNATIHTEELPLLPKVDTYLQQGCVPGGTHRNFASYGDSLPKMTAQQKAIVCDPQTSGGLMIAIDPQHVEHLETLLAESNLPLFKVGQFSAPNGEVCRIHFL
ncbi:selenide, water dikinase SelD [Vibrio parahaemolyticus]|nr:selenide, water dikinase SelD [Vibrio parahaemolyticus]MCG6461979.1 selenide, water dikinase SelD [Vibrio parahaemolyticus]